MSIAAIVTGGFSNGTFVGSIPFVVTRGYTIGEAVIVTDGVSVSGDIITFLDMAGTINDNPASSTGLIKETLSVTGVIE